MFQKIEIEIDIPDGYEFVRYGVPEIGEQYLGVIQHHVHLREPESNLTSKYFIVRKVKQWRDPVLPADFGKQARFSDDGEAWNENRLVGWYKIGDHDPFAWIDPKECGWRFCQVCDEEKK